MLLMCMETALAHPATAATAHAPACMGGHEPLWKYVVLQVFTADVESAIKADAESHHGIFLGTRKDLPAVTTGQKSSAGSSSGAAQHQWPGGHGLHVC